MKDTILFRQQTDEEAVLSMIPNLNLNSLPI